jgi:hypothetical protein
MVSISRSSKDDGAALADRPAIIAALGTQGKGPGFRKPLITFSMMRDTLFL